MCQLFEEGERRSDTVEGGIGHAGKIGTRARGGRGRNVAGGAKISREEKHGTGSEDDWCRAGLGGPTWLAGVMPARQAEAERLLAIFGEETGWEPRLWGPSMVGFGRYAYRYDSGHSGRASRPGSPRKAELSIYILPGGGSFGQILARLGPHRMTKACPTASATFGGGRGGVAQAIRAGLADLGTRWQVHPA